MGLSPRALLMWSGLGGSRPLLGLVRGYGQFKQRSFDVLGSLRLSPPYVHVPVWSIALP